jgi:hypothetical protein
MLPADLFPSICCDEHRRQLLRFTELPSSLLNVDVNSLAHYFARQCQNNKRVARIARRQAALLKRETTDDDKSTSPFHVVDRILAAPTSIYGVELNNRSFHELCSRQDLKLTFERYVKSLKLEDYNIIPFAFDVQLKFRSLSFLSKAQMKNRLMSMTQINLKECKINRVHKGSSIYLKSIVDPFVTPRSIQSIVEDKNGNAIRIAIYNWHLLLGDQTIERIQNRISRSKRFIVGNPFIKMAADGLLILRIDNPRLEMFFIDYEEQIDSMNCNQLRDLGKHNDLLDRLTVTNRCCFYFETKIRRKNTITRHFSLDLFG